MPRAPRVSRAVTLAAAGDRAIKTLLHVYYAGKGEWNACNAPGCPRGNGDWGYDSLTYTLAMREQQTGDASLLPMLQALSAGARTYPNPCVTVSSCPSWSDVPEWDTIALVDEYQATHDPNALAKAKRAFSFVARSRVFARGACPAIPYEVAGGGRTDLKNVKTLETQANAVKAALLLFRATHDFGYLSYAAVGYQAARRYFLDAYVPLYRVYVIDDGRSCRQVRRLFFASVNGDMIWSGVELYKDTAQSSYLTDATATATAVAADLADPRGIFADLQTENDIVEPMVEGMAALAATRHPAPPLLCGHCVARHWLLANAAAALSARTSDGSFGRFFDGPPPITIVTAWQTNGGLSLEVAVAAIAPGRFVHTTTRWRAQRYVLHEVASLPARFTFRGSGIALFGTLGEIHSARGHQRVFVDGRETFDHAGAWQNQTHSGRKIPRTILFSWSWRRSETHTLTFLPDGKRNEGGPFPHIVGYALLRRG